MNAFDPRPIFSGALIVLSTLAFTACSPWQAVGREPLRAGDAQVATASPPIPESGFVYTADERGRSVSVIDLGTGRVTTFPTGIAPHNVQVSRDGRLLLVVGEAVADTSAVAARPAALGEMGAGQGGELLVLDTAAMRADGAIRIKVGNDPAHVVVDKQNKRAYVTNSMENNLAIVDLDLQKIVATVATGRMPHGLRMSPDARELYVANADSNFVSVIDVARRLEVARVSVGKAPVQVGFTPDGRRAYVSLRDENSVAVIDTARRKKIATVAVGRNPIQVFVTPDGRHVYVANQGTEANPDNTVSVIDTAYNSVVATIVTGKGAHGVVVSDDGRRAFVANIADDSVSVIDTASRVVVETIKVGKGPNGITFRLANR